MVNQWSVLDPKPTALTKTRTVSASSPSAISEVAGLSRRERTSPITMGATVTIPSASEANQRGVDEC